MPNRHADVDLTREGRERGPTPSWGRGNHPEPCVRAAPGAGACDQGGNPGPPLNAAATRRFWAKVDRTKEGCWIWKASVNAKGYGYFRFGGSCRLAHRIAWLLTHGSEAPDCLCHRCDNPRCVNPAHLFPGSRADNNRDMHRKGRYAHGAGHHRSKLGPESVAAIRAEAASGARGVRAALARRFGVSRGTITEIVQRKAWRDA